MTTQIERDNINKGLIIIIGCFQMWRHSTNYIYPDGCECSELPVHLHSW